MEILDVVNDFDEVIGQAPRSEVYKRHLNHRIVHVLIFNQKGEMLLQLRSKHKPFLPGYWSTSVGGCVLAGESYEQAAMREMNEELGIKLELKLSRQYSYPDPRGFKMMTCLFIAKSEGPFKPNPEEVERLEFVSIEKISLEEKLHPELKLILSQGFSSSP